MLSVDDDGQSYNGRHDLHGVIAELFSQLTRELCGYLEKILPKLSNDWWKGHVLAQLSYQQIQIVEQHRITELSRLDLAALLRILDRNWFEVVNGTLLPSDSRWTLNLTYEIG